MAVQRTRDSSTSEDSRPGLVPHLDAALGARHREAAASFKTDELKMLAQKGLVPAFGFGKMTSDSMRTAPPENPAPDNRVFYQINGAFQGKRIESYKDPRARLHRSPADDRNDSRAAS